MKLFAKFLAFVLVLVALVWAKKHFLDKRSDQTATAETSSQAGGTSTPKLTITPAGNGGTSSATSSAEDESKIASLLNMAFHGGSNASPEDKARLRMKAFMQAWKEGGTSLGDAEQAAACLWSRGKRFIPDGPEIQDAYNGFTKFRQEKGLYTTINDYAIADTIERGHDETHGDYSTFAVTINGQSYTMGVPDRANPIFWK